MFEVKYVVWLPEKFPHSLQRDIQESAEGFNSRQISTGNKICPSNEPLFGKKKKRECSSVI